MAAIAVSASHAPHADLTLVEGACDHLRLQAKPRAGTAFCNPSTEYAQSTMPGIRISSVAMRKILRCDNPKQAH